jgi:hypothetical protein
MPIGMPLACQKRKVESAIVDDQVSLPVCATALPFI